MQQTGRGVRRRLISILHKYDYNSFDVYIDSLQNRFQFYISTIIIAMTNYVKRLGVSFQFYISTIIMRCI